MIWLSGNFDVFMQNLLRLWYEKILLLTSVIFRGDYPTNSLYAWIKKLGPESTQHNDLADAQAEIKRLQKELKRATEERDILKKAAAYFAKQSD